MFSQSGTQTPVPSSQHGNQLQKVQFHEVLGETVTWVNEWYLPNLITSSNLGESNVIVNQPSLEDDSATPAISDSIRLKGWHKTNINHKQSNNVLNPNDILDLSTWKYFKTPMVDETQIPSNGTETPIKKEEPVGSGVLGEVISF